MIVLHDLKGREVYISSVYVSAVYPVDDAIPGAPGSIVALQGNLVQVKETPGAIFYLLKQAAPK